MMAHQFDEEDNRSDFLTMMMDGTRSTSNSSSGLERRNRGGDRLDFGQFFRQIMMQRQLEGDDDSEN